MTKVVVKKKNGKKTRIEKREIEKEFWFELTGKEKDQFGKQAGNINGDVTQDEMKFADIKKEWLTKIKAKKADLTAVLEILRKGKEFRKVKCTEVKDFGKGEIKWVMNKKTIRTVKMREEDSQMSLGMPDKTTKKKVTKKTKAVAPPSNHKSRDFGAV